MIWGFKYVDKPFFPNNYCDQMIGNITKEEGKVLIQKVVHGLLNDTRPNTWEKEFLSNINDQLPVRDLSEKQLSVLNKIKQKYLISAR